MKLTKSALMTDIHFGGKANSVQHNEDCIRYLKWFCGRVKADKDIDHVVFLGDWNQERSAIDILTMNYSHTGAKLLNDLGLPIYFVLGNHDLYKRHSREIHSIVQFELLDNFIPIYEPTEFNEIGDGMMLCPYLFHDEYTQLSQFSHVPVWGGHFEFSGFVITGYSTKMKGGPNADDFSKPKNILSGHFHKRQTQKNVTFIGNCFPTNFGDEGDTDRGMATYDHTTNDLQFINWDECPVYTRVTLTDLLDGQDLPMGARVKCVINVPIDHSESSTIRKTYTEQFKLRAFNLEESPEVREALVETSADEDVVVVKATNTNEMVCEMLMGIDTKQIDNDMLIEIYQSLEVDNND